MRGILSNKGDGISISVTKILGKICKTHSLALHTPCRHLVHTLHTPCTHLAHTLHTPCTHLAHTLQTPCTHLAHTLHRAPAAEVEAMAWQKGGGGRLSSQPNRVHRFHLRICDVITPLKYYWSKLCRSDVTTGEGCGGEVRWAMNAEERNPDSQFKGTQQLQNYIYIYAQLGVWMDGWMDR
jgi:hypothetical protein